MAFNRLKKELVKVVEESDKEAPKLREISAEERAAYEAWQEAVRVTVAAQRATEEAQQDHQQKFTALQKFALGVV